MKPLNQVRPIEVYTLNHTTKIYKLDFLRPVYKKVKTRVKDPISSVAIICYGS